MISVEKERVNFILINLLKGIIKKEMTRYNTIKEVDFSAYDSIIGKIFYRVMRS